jgi:peptidoglycan-associated lipoprotein
VNDPNQHTEDKSALAANTVHFEYDSSVIKSGEQANVEAVASYLKSNGDVGLRVDGHCDERGTEGYNDSLGERRASALREALIGLGANPNLVITRSLGEREPVATGNDESAYAKNRRGEFIVLRRK